MSKQLREQQPFSQQLEDWLKNGKDKSFDGLIDLFEEKAFAIIFLLMMALPALPIPTGGVTHVTEVLTLVGAVQLIAGRRKIWVPGWAKRKINVEKLMSGKGGQKLISFIKWIEKWSRRRGSGLLKQTPILSFVGFLVTFLTVAAFVAPPFSGLDTLPALGVVIISLSLILEDSALLLFGIFIGASGIVLDAFLFQKIVEGFHHLKLF